MTSLDIVGDAGVEVSEGRGEELGSGAREWHEGSYSGIMDGIPSSRARANDASRCSERSMAGDLPLSAICPFTDDVLEAGGVDRRSEVGVSATPRPIPGPRRRSAAKAAASLGFVVDISSDFEVEAAASF